MARVAGSIHSVSEPDGYDRSTAHASRAPFAVDTGSLPRTRIVSDSTEPLPPTNGRTTRYPRTSGIDCTTTSSIVVLNDGAVVVTLIAWAAESFCVTRPVT